MKKPIWSRWEPLDPAAIEKAAGDATAARAVLVSAVDTDTRHDAAIALDAAFGAAAAAGTGTSELREEDLSPLRSVVERWACNRGVSREVRLAVAVHLYAAAAATAAGQGPWDLARVARAITLIGKGRWSLVAWLLADLVDVASAAVQDALGGEATAERAERAARALEGLLRGVHRCAVNSCLHGHCWGLGEAPAGCVCPFFDPRSPGRCKPVEPGVRLGVWCTAGPPWCLALVGHVVLVDLPCLMEAAGAALSALEAGGERQLDKRRPEQAAAWDGSSAGVDIDAVGPGGSGSGSGSNNTGPATASAAGVGGIRMDPSRWHPAITAAVRRYASSPWSPLLVPCRVPGLWAGLPGDVLVKVVALAGGRRVPALCKAWRASWLATVHTAKLPANHAGALAGLRNLRRLVILEPAAVRRRRPGNGPAGAVGAGGEADDGFMALDRLLAPAVGAGSLCHLECLTIQRLVPAASAGGQWLGGAALLSGLRRLELPAASHLADLPACLSALAGSLTSLTVQDGCLQHMPAVVASLTCLRELRLPGNCLTALLPGGDDGAGSGAACVGQQPTPSGPTDPGPAAQQQQQQQQPLALPPRLELLDASHNSLTCPEGLEALAGLTRLRRLFLNDNHPPLQGLPHCMTGLTTLTALDLGQCHLDPSRAAKPPPLPLPASLRQLRIRGCNWIHLPPEICCCTALEQLDCEDHAFRVIPDQISQLRNLRDLNIAGGPAGLLCPQARRGLVSAVVLPPADSLTQGLTSLTRLVVDQLMCKAPPPSGGGHGDGDGGAGAVRAWAFDSEAWGKLEELAGRAANPVCVVGLRSKFLREQTACVFGRRGGPVTASGLGRLGLAGRGGERRASGCGGAEGWGRALGDDGESDAGGGGGGESSPVRSDGAGDG